MKYRGSRGNIQQRCHGWLMSIAAMGIGVVAQSAAADGSGQPLALRVQDNRLVDSRGSTLQLRGASVSGLEGGVIFGERNGIWSSSGFGDRPDFTRLGAWKLNAVRLPLNEDSWLGKTVTDMAGRVIALDGAAYRAEVRASVAAANAAGLYVLLDLHWAAPASFAANTQNPMMDADNSVSFWVSIANTFKDNLAVAFELYNEPYIAPLKSADGVFAVASIEVPDHIANAIIRDGGAASAYFGRSNGRFDGAVVRRPDSWQSTGYQTVIDAVRATGATNVILCGGNHYSNDLTWWTQGAPVDPAHELAASLHAYAGGYPYNLATDKAAVDAMLADIVSSHPLVITEMGDEVGRDPAQFAAGVLAWADLHGYSVLAWTWNPWRGANALISDVTRGTATPGLGRTFQQWAIHHKQ